MSPGRRLSIATSLSSDRVKPGDDPATVLAGTPIKTITRAKVDPDHDYLIGTFQHTDGRRAVLLNNYQFAYTAWPTMEFDLPPEQDQEIDQQTGKVIPADDDSPAMPGLQFSLDAGQGRLFLWPPKAATRQEEREASCPAFFARVGS